MMEGDIENNNTETEEKVQDMSSPGSLANTSDSEANKPEKIESNGIEEGESHGGGAPVAEDPAVTKDFPDLAPTKSMDFPDGSSLSLILLIRRRHSSLVDCGRRIFLLVLLFWFH
jgi:hypothetical protein